MSTQTINYKGITESYSIFYVEILIPDGLGKGKAYTLLSTLIHNLYNHNPKVLLRDVDDLPYGRPRAFVYGIPDRGEWPEGVLKEDDVKREKGRVRRMWAFGGWGGGGGGGIW